MSSDISEALQALHAMASAFMHRLPYLVLALLVFALFYLAGKGVRHSIRRLTARRRRHRNPSLTIGAWCWGA